MRTVLLFATKPGSRLSLNLFRLALIVGAPQSTTQPTSSMGAASIAAAAGSRAIWAQAPKDVKQSTLDRIAIMTLNFQNILKVPDVEDSPNRTLELFDVAQMIADKYGVHKVEFQHYHIPSTEPSYLKELRSRIEKSKSRMTQINLEFSGLNMATTGTVLPFCLMVVNCGADVLS